MIDFYVLHQPSIMFGFSYRAEDKVLEVFLGLFALGYMWGE